jgi:hypothetical protein
MGAGGPFPGVKARPGRDADQSPPSSAEIKTVETLTVPPSDACMAVAGPLYLRLGLPGIPSFQVLFGLATKRGLKACEILQKT